MPITYERAVALSMAPPRSALGWVPWLWVTCHPPITSFSTSILYDRLRVVYEDKTGGEAAHEKRTKTPFSCLALSR